MSERLLLAGGGVALGSWLLVGFTRLYALRRGVLDVPNERSSHSTATPRGGGAGLLVAAVMGFYFMAPDDVYSPTLWLALVGLIPTAIAGWMDDHRPLSVRTRLSAHVLSALMVLPLAVEQPGGPSFVVPLVVGLAWMFATVSAINVVNFMDGIDGLIGLQAMIFGFHLLSLGGHSPGGVLGLCLAAASAGFLVWNWAPAKIFLGDVGSGATAVLGVVGGMLVWRTTEWPFLSVFLPLFPIFLDATVTIIRRLRRGERMFEAHRTHLYQRLAVERSWGHSRVAFLFGALAVIGAVIARHPPFASSAGTVLYAAAVSALAWALDGPRSIRPN